jgi:hypothetical protein
MRARPVITVLLVLLVLFAAVAPAAPAVRLAGPAAAVLMDVRTGRVLYARAMQQKMAPASTTKVMTALLAIERLPPDAMVPISREAGAMRRGAVIGIRPGERWRVDDLLHAAMLRSANDAAVALAEAVAGSVPRFAALMNARAARLGARSTHFVNPHGLDAPDHYSTAHDLALIARAALHNHRFAVLVRTPVWTLDRPDRGREELANRNQLLTRYAGADGVKTGLTASAGYTFVGSATRDGWQLLAVVLKSHDMYADAGRPAARRTGVTTGRLARRPAAADRGRDPRCRGAGPRGRADRGPVAARRRAAGRTLRTPCGQIGSSGKLGTRPETDRTTARPRPSCSAGRPCFARAGHWMWRPGSAGMPSTSRAPVTAWTRSTSRRRVWPRRRGAPAGPVSVCGGSRPTWTPSRCPRPATIS